MEILLQFNSQKMKKKVMRKNEQVHKVLSHDFIDKIITLKHVILS